MGRAISLINLLPFLWIGPQNALHYPDRHSDRPGTQISLPDAATWWPTPWGFPGLQCRGKEWHPLTLSSGTQVSHHHQRGLRSSLERHPQSADRVGMGQPMRGWGQSRLSTQNGAPPPLRQASRRWSVLLEGDLHQWRWFRFAITWHIPLLFKNSKVPEWVRKSIDAFKPQTETIQVKPQTFRKTFPGKAAHPIPLNRSAAEGPSWDRTKRESKDDVTEWLLFQEGMEWGVCTERGW